MLVKMSKNGDSLSLYEQNLQRDVVSLIEVPLELGSDARGLRAAPQYLLSRGLKEALVSSGLTVESVRLSCPNAPVARMVGRIKHVEEVVAVAHETSAVVAHRARKEFALVLGGDHSVSLGSIAGALKAQHNLGVIWIDAHADANTDETIALGQYPRHACCGAHGSRR
jgi:arginase